MISLYTVFNFWTVSLFVMICILCYKNSSRKYHCWSSFFLSIAHLLFRWLLYSLIRLRVFRTRLGRCQPLQPADNLLLCLRLQGDVADSRRWWNRRLSDPTSTLRDPQQPLQLTREITFLAEPLCIGGRMERSGHYDAKCRMYGCRILGAGLHWAAEAEDELRGVKRWWTRYRHHSTCVVLSGLLSPWRLRLRQCNVVSVHAIATPHNAVFVAATIYCCRPTIPPYSCWQQVFILYIASSARRENP
jgi:hypothetical protein